MNFFIIFSILKTVQLMIGCGSALDGFFIVS